MLNPYEDLEDELREPSGNPTVDGLALAHRCAVNAYEKSLVALQLVRNVEEWTERDVHRFDFAVGVLREWYQIFQDQYDLEIGRAKVENEDVG